MKDAKQFYPKRRHARMQCLRLLKQADETNLCGTVIRFSFLTFHDKPNLLILFWMSYWPCQGCGLAICTCSLRKQNDRRGLFRAYLKHNASGTLRRYHMTILRLPICLWFMMHQ